MGELLHGSATAVGTEGGPTAHPLGALLGDSALGEFVFEPNLELTAVENALAFQLRDVKFPALLLDLVRGLVRNKCRRGENELE
jgi:hypothetical protein